MLEEPPPFGRWRRSKDGELAYSPAPRVATVREALGSSAIGIGITSVVALALALARWPFEPDATHGIMLGVFAHFAGGLPTPVRHYRRWRSATATFFLVWLAIGIGAGLALHELPGPWNGYLPVVLGRTAGIVVFARVTGAGARRTTG